MSMSGTHALAGLAMGVVVGMVARSRGRGEMALVGTAAFGFVVGALLPDIDFVLTTVLWPLDETTAERMHRTFTHSFVSLVPIAAIGGLSYRRNREWGTLVLAVVAGMVSHIVFDLVFWFEEVGALWPLHALTDAIPFWIDIYGGYDAPELFTKIIFGWEYGSLALYVAVLYWLSTRLGTDEAYRSRLKLWGGLYFLMFLVSMALVPLYELDTYQVIVFAPSAPFFWPLAVWITYRMRGTIGTLATNGLAPDRSSA
jgi:membrane-bound metal-dependent hydrolase YbcI (DUF457 family)